MGQKKPTRRKTVDASKWQGFAIAYIDENGKHGCCIHAKTTGEAKKLLRSALKQLHVVLL